MSEKIPYERTERRFEISPDEISRERFKFIKREIFDKLREEFPGVINMTIWGSLSKGKELTPETAFASDIDMSVFIDTDKIKEMEEDEFLKTEGLKQIYTDELDYLRKYVDWLEDNKGESFKGRGYTMVPVKTSKEEIEDKRKEIPYKAKINSFKKYIENFIEEKLEHSAEQLNLDPESLKTEGFKAYFGPHLVSMNPNSENYMGKMIEGYEEAGYYDGSLTDNETWGLGLAIYFQMGIAGGMKKYIRSFLGDLKRSENEGKQKRYWNWIKDAVLDATYKDHKDLFKNNFPQTFEEACKRYGT